MLDFSIISHILLFKTCLVISKYFAHPYFFNKYIFFYWLYTHTQLKSLQGSLKFSKKHYTKCKQSILEMTLVLFIYSLWVQWFTHKYLNSVPLISSIVCSVTSQTLEFMQMVRSRSFLRQRTSYKMSLEKSAYSSPIVYCSITALLS